MDKNFFVYMMASQENGTIYTGVTSDLPKRIAEHKQGIYGGFTDKYGVKLLVWYEQHETAESAIVREKRIKNWKRNWKIKRIVEMNPDWRDLYDDICH